MSTTPNSEHDDRVVGQLRELPAGTTTAQYFDRALELGASAALLSRMTIGYITTDPHDPHRVIGLPYVGTLLAAGWSTDAVRELVSTNCLTDHGQGEGHYQREGFWRDTEAWRLFETAEQLMPFLRRFAAESTRLVLTPEGRATLTDHLGPLVAEHQVLLRYIRELEEIATLAQQHIDNEYRLGIAIRVAVPKKPHEQLAMAAGRNASGWNLVFMGYVLAKHGSDSYEGSGVTSAIYQQMERAPHTQAAVYRWLAEGFRRADNQYWQFHLEDSIVPGMFASYGWHPLPIATGPNGGAQVTLPGKPHSPRIIVRHTPDGEPLTEGDLVLIHRDQLKDLTPITIPGGKVYTLRLTPAAPATPEMLAESGSYFYNGPFKERRKYA